MELIQDESIRDIPGYEGHYAATTIGRVGVTERPGLLTFKISE